MIDFEPIVPLPLDGLEPQQDQSAAAPLLFRGLPITWAAAQKTKTILVSVSAFEGEDDTRDIEYNNYLIAYKGNHLTRRDFLKCEFDEWTTQEIYAQGFSRKTLDKFVEHGLIERVKRGHYVRKSV